MRSRRFASGGCSEIKYPADGLRALGSKRPDKETYYFKQVILKGELSPPSPLLTWNRATVRVLKKIAQSELKNQVLPPKGSAKDMG